MGKERTQLQDDIQLHLIGPNGKLKSTSQGYQCLSVWKRIRKLIGI